MWMDRDQSSSNINEKDSNQVNLVNLDKKMDVTFRNMQMLWTKKPPERTEERFRKGSAAFKHANSETLGHRDKQTPSNRRQDGQTGDTGSRPRWTKRTRTGAVGSALSKVQRLRL